MDFQGGSEKCYFNGRPQRLPSGLVNGLWAKLIGSYRAQNCYIAARLQVGGKLMMSNYLLGPLSQFYISSHETDGKENYFFVGNKKA